jgi:NADH-quinone oxidoreductase subunit E
MTHYLIELFLWVLLAFVVGCILGWFLRSRFARRQAEGTRRAVRPAPLPPGPIPAPLATPSAPPAALSTPPVAGSDAPAPTPPAPVMGRPERPKGIARARGGKPDKLQRISGIGPKNERVLHNLGFYHFDQIAAWSAEQIAWVDDHLKFNGRIVREAWVEQAKLLAEGREEEFARLYGTGGLRDRSGERKSGERTRRS